MPLRCFTFPDFQIAPTLEELERILDQPIRDHNPFPKLEEDINMAKLASLLGLDMNEVVAKWKAMLVSLLNKRSGNHVVQSLHL